MPGHDNILERARLLAAAANQMADQMSMQVAHLSEHAQSRREETEALQETKKKQEIQKHEIEREKNARLFKGAAIAGSTLVTTYGDIRPYAPRGSVIVIDGNRCRLLEKGEYTASRVELVEDYAGETNLDASIEVGFEAGNGLRSPKKNKAKVVPTEEVRGAVALLDDIKFPTATFAMSDTAGGLSPGRKKGKTTTGAASDSKKNSNKPSKPSYPNMSDYILSSNPASEVLSTVSKSSAPPPMPLFVQPPPSSSMINSEPPSPQDRATSTMLQELRLKEAYGFPQQSYLNMNKRMASEGRLKAKERVQERKKRLEEEAQEQHFAQMEALNPDPIQVVEKRLELERKKALARAAQKKREDEQRLLARLEQERIEQEELKQKMKEKADQLAIATAERVEKIKREKLLAQQREAEQREAEMQRKREAQAAVADRAYDEKVEKLRQQTQERLNRIREQEMAKQRAEAEETARKLRELAQARGRSVPMSQLPSLNGSEYDGSSRYGDSHEGYPRSRPSSVGAAQSHKIRHSAPAKNNKKQTHDGRGGDPSGESSVPSLPPLPHGPSAGSIASSGQVSAALRSSSGGAKYRPTNPVRTMLYNGKAIPRSDQSEGLSSARAGSKVNSDAALIRQHTPIQTTPMPDTRVEDEEADDFDVSGDSLDERMGDNIVTKAAKKQPPSSYGALYRNQNSGGMSDNFDNMSLVSALTGDETTWAGVHSNSISEHQIANGQKPSGIPQPPQKRKVNKTPVWRKLQPIEVRPYVPVPNASP